MLQARTSKEDGAMMRERESMNVRARLKERDTKRESRHALQKKAGARAQKQCISVLS